jgi:hypothetical protein
MKQYHARSLVTNSVPPVYAGSVYYLSEWPSFGGKGRGNLYHDPKTGWFTSAKSVKSITIGTRTNPQAVSILRKGDRGIRLRHYTPTKSSRKRLGRVLTHLPPKSFAQVEKGMFMKIPEPYKRKPVDYSSPVSYKAVVRHTYPSTTP